MGNLEIFRKQRIKRILRNKKFSLHSIGFDCEANTISEVHENRNVDINLHETYPEQYGSLAGGVNVRGYGKGFLFLKKRKDDGTKDDELISVVDPGNPHKLEIFNLETSDSSGVFSINNQTNAKGEKNKQLSVWQVGIRLKAGNVRLPALVNDRSLDAKAQDAVFINVLTPIGTQWRMVVGSGESSGGSSKSKVIKVIKDNFQEPWDISELVLQINDGWSADGFTSINHEMQVKCYIPLGVPTGTGEILDRDTARTVNSNNEIGEAPFSRPDLHGLGRKILSLIDKTFYITVSYWWDKGIGKKTAIDNEIIQDTLPVDSMLLIQMTGIAKGGSIERSANRLFFNFTIHDYMQIFRDQFFFNSPNFDAVQDVIAIMEIAKLAGFDDDDTKKFDPTSWDWRTRSWDSRNDVDRRPLGYIQKVIEEGSRAGGRPNKNKFLYNGEVSFTEKYLLPLAFADLAEPKMRFQNGETYENALKKIATLKGSVVYFDRWGVLKFETTSAILAAFQQNNIKRTFKPKMDFFTSPAAPIDEDLGQLGEDPVKFDPEVHAAHLVYNTISYTRSVQDAISQLVVMTASNDIKLANGQRTGGYIVKGHTFYDQILDPNAEGFIGYRKMFYQANGVFGDEEQVKNAMRNYAKFHSPPAQISFETYGVPGLKPLDIITLNNNLFYIQEISHEIDPGSNKWWMNISAEWLKPFTGDLGFLDEAVSTATPP